MLNVNIMRKSLLKAALEGKLTNGDSSQWEQVKLEECATCLDSFRKPINAQEREKIKGNIPYYGATGQIGWVNDYLTNEHLVLLGEDGAPFLDPFKNKAYIIEGKAWVNNHAHILRSLYGEVGNKYLMYYLNAFNYNGYVNGTTRLKLTQANMKRIPILLPSLSEQLLIVSKLDSLFECLDNLDKAQRKFQHDREIFRKSILKAALEGKLTNGDSSQWQWVKLGEVGNAQTGTTPPKDNPEYFGHDIPFIKPADIHSNYIDYNNEGLTWEGVKKGRYIPANSVLMVCIGTVGRTFYTDRPVSCNQQINAITPFNVDYKYLYYVMSSPYFQDEALKFTHSTTLPILNKRNWSNILIPLPPLEEQQRIVSRLDELMSVIDSLADTESIKHVI